MSRYFRRIPTLASVSLLIALLSVAMVTLAPDAAAAPGDVTADSVLGQSGSFLTGGCAVTASSMCSPSGVAVDSAGNVYVADSQNNRVLEYDTPLSSDLVADRVFGQGGSLTTKTCNLGGISASSLCYPVDVAVDTAGNLFVVDFTNNRVLEYFTPLSSDTIADRVFGQSSMSTGTFIGFWFNTSPTADTLANPISVAIDGAGHLYIGDRGFHRVLEYDPPLTNTTADRVFGQYGSFTTGTPNNGGVSANSLQDFNGIGVDPAGNLYVADSNNARVLMYNTPTTTDTTADLVFGQYGNFTTNAPNIGGVSADTLETPTDVVADSAGNVIITDTGQERSLIFDNPPVFGTTADVVFGQGGNFNSSGNNTGGLGANSQADPWSVVVDGPCNLWIADYGNNRVLEYDQPPHACVVVAGTTGPTSTIPPATPTPTPSPTPGAGCTPGPLGPCTPTPVPTACVPAPCPNTPTPSPTPCLPVPGDPCTSTPAPATPTPAAVGGVSELVVDDDATRGGAGGQALLALLAAVSVAVVGMSVWHVRRNPPLG